MFQEDKNLHKPGIDSPKTDIVNQVTKQADITDPAKFISQTNNITEAQKNFMNQVQIPNDSSIIQEKVWAKQPTSKIFNAQGISENAMAGINRVVKLEIFVEGQAIKFFKHFKLKQSAVKHHSFEITLAHDTLGNAENHNLEAAQSFLGKRITVVFKYKDVGTSPERNFVGVITEVGFSQEKGSLGNLVLEGFSPTILLDAAPHIQSFGGKQEMSLNSIASQVLEEGLGQGKFDFRVDARHGNVSYSSQYEETHYNYLARIAEAYGEQFFYDGEVLHFGKLPPQEQSVKLVYGSNLNDVKIKMKAQHVNPTFYGYNSSKNEKLTTGSSKISHTSDIAKRAYEISEKTFKTPSLRIAPIKASSFMDVDASQKGTAGSKASEVFVTSGTTTVPFLYPGCIVDIEMRKTDSNNTSYFTKLMLIEVTHEVDARGYYDGTFEAIASDTGFIPRPEFILPKAEPQFGKVISNTDPQNQGRVQIQLDWQKGPDTTEFIRVMSPDAGSSDKVNKNRGFMSIPEVGDQVIVNFVHQHPDRPFVMGGMFHGGIGGGGGKGNNIKSLSSKSGNIVELNDGGGITVRDKAQNQIHVDGSGNISSSSSTTNTSTVGGTKESPEGQASMKMDNSGAIDIMAKTNFKIAVGEGNSFEITSGGSGTLNLTADLTINIGGSIVTLCKDGTINILGKKITVNGSSNVTIEGGEVDVN
ncbi:type VI secretion system Vgr family protein [Chryseobacterium sp. BIGb0232]|uniref:type VI secretion system Vgr family protein n=1 Tax=Chryseobacterium sp. BIGb0232 TaxID=2940598 RepID=UPI000F4622AE|nr:uncharacterized protein involved in type VI secretion and phage assembly [Chryseobacterium sp. BIGb0232]ROS20556.1 uncharacterized protein involved in type VI secretion and phage assembly [Chryseobacterium nakagawai]